MSGPSRPDNGFRWKAEAQKYLDMMKAGEVWKAHYFLLGHKRLDKLRRALKEIDAD